MSTEQRRKQEGYDRKVHVQPYFYASSAVICMKEASRVSEVNPDGGRQDGVVQVMVHATWVL